MKNLGSLENYMTRLQTLDSSQEASNIVEAARSRAQHHL
jgi:hypothetical protein